MIEIYLHEIYYTNKQVTTFDADRPCDFEGQFVRINYPNGGAIVINMEQVNCVNIKHLTFTEEEYENRKKLLNHEE